MIEHSRLIVKHSHLIKSKQRIKILKRS